MKKAKARVAELFVLEWLKERKIEMANEKKIDCVILGLLSHEELTGYEIKKRMDTTLKYFWGASYGSIYPALNDLVNRGLATKREDTNSKRNKLIYTITESGHDYLKNWLSLPVEKDELRYETLLKLFFGSEKGEEQALIHIEAFEKKIKEELLYLLHAETILNKVLNEDTAHKYYLLTIEFGIKTYQTYLEWCKEAKKLLAGG
ncbi:MAG: PadR family transcriptional regulator [Lachnospiraceae bacterium]|nr:PadR family transcriptional regulator [Lachnospiraceae bacterium]MCM1215661.1 PadR family transcriptional regulator [Lachnospiraceae bacterium]MCM1238469.1 PadR family transcriptional regulator [Lachnospiraceae bacterium]